MYAPQLLGDKSGMRDEVDRLLNEVDIDELKTLGIEPIELSKDDRKMFRVMEGGVGGKWGDEQLMDFLQRNNK